MSGKAMNSIEKLNKEVEVLGTVLKTFTVISLIIIALYSFYGWSLITTINRQQSTINQLQP